MKLTDFDYSLPEELIAQQPLPHRSSSRLMAINRATGHILHRQFAQLPELLKEGDLLIRNDTRVIPARLHGHKETGGQVELLLTQLIDPVTQSWHCMTRSSKALRVGTQLLFPEGVSGEVTSEGPEGLREIRFTCEGDFMAFLERIGRIPLPPYIKRDDDLADRERYQTVFASTPGAVAAPTAGLHFTDETFSVLAERGVEVGSVTLHVGPGTFVPVRVEDLSAHRMHHEQYEIQNDVATMINAARTEGRRVIALGTTVTRTLESAVDSSGRCRPGTGHTDLFILPGFAFKLVDAMITNFHLPKSTLLMLVSAFAGRDMILEAYREAVAERYRFFSYGDCMLIE